MPEPVARRQDLLGNSKPALRGDDCRDWTAVGDEVAIFPYDDGRRILDVEQLDESVRRWFWRLRAYLWARKRFGGLTYREAGLPWFAWHQLPRDEGASSWSLAWGEIASHNHFLLDRGHDVLNRTAPIAKLAATATEEQHLALLGLLNSSTVCFWLKQVCHPKGGDPVGSAGARVSASGWDDRYAFNASNIKRMPVPARRPTRRARALDELAQRLVQVMPAAACRVGVPSRASLDEARAEYTRIRGEMVAVQEELDWETYEIYGLLDEDLTTPTDALPPIKPGERAFEVVLARKLVEGEAETQWFARHGSTPITEIPPQWPAAYKEVVRRRIEAIEQRSDLGLIERPECKRRWSATPWEQWERQALREWLLGRLEAPDLWRERGQAHVFSVARLADRVGVNSEFRAVMSLYCGRDDYDLTAELVKLTADETVPYLPAFRYKESGRRKRAVWEETWDLQRREDAGEKVGEVPVPPRYALADFARQSYWSNRGSLDLPKERFILYTNGGRDADKTPVLGWAGWDHLDQADAIANLYLARKNDDAWEAPRLLPLLAGLVELEPWLHQWHAEPDDSGESPAAYYTSFIDTELASLAFGRADLTPERLLA